jgi:hypothetical protein
MPSPATASQSLAHRQLVREYNQRHRALLQEGYTPAQMQDDTELQQYKEAISTYHNLLRLAVRYDANKHDSRMRNKAHGRWGSPIQIDLLDQVDIDQLNSDVVDFGFANINADLLMSDQSRLRVVLHNVLMVKKRAMGLIRSMRREDYVDIAQNLELMFEGTFGLIHNAIMRRLTGTRGRP